MKSKLLCLCIVLFNLNAYAQIAYQKGYFINNFNSKTECLINNVDWLNNPTNIQYKLTEDQEPINVDIANIQEFGIYNTSEYQRKTVNIDRSSSNLSDLDSDRNPRFKSETLLLKVLVKGEATLYEYVDGEIIRYFYNINKGETEQLVFKNYELPNGKIGENNKYRQQLWNNLKCESINKNNISYLAYSKDALVSIFVKYNSCKSQDFINYEEKDKKDLFDFTIRPGVNFSSLSIGYSASGSNIDTDVGNSVSFRFGVEAEVFLPFNRSKWSIILEPTYQYYKKETDLADDNSVKVDYSSIELPIGIRYYFIVNEASQLFTNVSLVYDFNGDSTVEFEKGITLETSTSTSFAFGFGYKHNRKYSVEVRYLYFRNFLSDYNFWQAKYNNLSLIFGYTF